MHDEIMLEVKKEHEEEAKELLTEAMLAAAYEMIQGIRFKIECLSGENWASCH
jgi:DNA polymerase I-like protein with 3'-5' exonuclease and polymerase domains